MQDYLRLPSTSAIPGYAPTKNAGQWRHPSAFDRLQPSGGELQRTAGPFNSYRVWGI
jgi:hypothetical protein